MYITAVVAISLNGFITDGDNPDVTSWTSAEDKAFFRAQKDSSDVMVLGSKTYLDLQRVIKPEAERLRLVLTSKPEKFNNSVVKGQLEFSNLQPSQLVKELDSRGYKKMMLVGGSQVYGDFLKAGLINELKVTIEPVIFASGTPLLLGLTEKYNLVLESSEKLNDRGTILLSYSCH